MAKERTLSIIKPDATRRNLTGKINAVFEDAGLSIVAQKRVQLTPAQAGAFYAVHKERPFYNDLVSFMISGPVVLQRTATLWARPTPRRPKPTPSARSLPKALKQTPFTVPTALKTPLTKSASSSRRRKSFRNVLSAGFSRRGKSKRVFSSYAGNTRSAFMGLFPIATDGDVGDVPVHGR
jgi:hypothetical protein